MSLEDLQYDGDRTEEDGIGYTLTVEPDLFCDVVAESDDGICFPFRESGRVQVFGVFAVRDWRLAWGRQNPYTGRNIRPDGFDGGAEIILRDGADALWWQIPADLRRGEGDVSACRSALRDLLEFGYSVVTLESSDGYTATLGGVEPSCDLPRYIVPDLANEIAYDRKRDRERALVAQCDRYLGTRLAAVTS